MFKRARTLTGMGTGSFLHPKLNNPAPLHVHALTCTFVHWVASVLVGTLLVHPLDFALPVGIGGFHADLACLTALRLRFQLE
jgi:hypothetical protein